MNKKEFQQIKKSLDAYSKAIMEAKQPEYTNNDDDVLRNFKNVAENLGLESQEVWAVYFYKHIQAILSHAHNPEMIEAEPIQSRYADAINYLYLGYGLYIEKLSNKQNKKDIISGTE